MRKIDYHMHTRFSLDSEANPEDHVKKAINLGLDEICFTDHYDVDFPGADFTMDIAAYMSYMKSLQKKYASQISIKIGIEMGLDPLHEKRINELIASYPFDFVIGSIHAVGNTEFMRADFFEGLSKEEAHKAYFEQCIACVDTFDCFNVFGHYDYIERYGIYEDNRVDTDLYWPLIDTFLKKLIAKNKGLEVNTSGFRLRGQGFPKKAILERYYALGGRIITIGSDSHESSSVGAHVEEVTDMLQQIGFKDVTTFSRGAAEI